MATNDTLQSTCLTLCPPMRSTPTRSTPMKLTQCNFLNIHVLPIVSTTWLAVTSSVFSSARLHSGLKCSHFCWTLTFVFLASPKCVILAVTNLEVIIAIIKQSFSTMMLARRSAMLNMSSHFVLNTCPLLSASFLAVSCYKHMCLTTSTYGITVLSLHSAYLLPLLP